MNRTRTAALLAAAVVGLSAGTVAAVIRSQDAAGGEATRSPRPSAAAPAPSGSGSAGTASPRETNEPLLYAGDGAIHDGETTVPVDLGEVRRITRAARGWLVGVIVPAPGETVLDDLWFVGRSGQTKLLGRVGTWDPDATGKRVVGYDVRASRVKLWSLPQGRVAARYATEGRIGMHPGFAGREVLMSVQSTDGAEPVDLVRWNPATSERRSVGVGYADQSMSPGGSYLAGSAGPEGISGTINGCLHVESTYLKKNAVDWLTCDWALGAGEAPFSPDGTRLVAIPSQSDGFGPGEIGIFDASDGPRRLVASFLTPPGTLTATWADNDHLYLTGSPTAEPGDTSTWIKRCDFRGACQEVASSRSRLAVNSGY